MYKSLRVQLLLRMLPLIAIPIFLLVAFSYSFYTQAIDEQATAFAGQMLEQVQLNVDTSVGEADRIITYMAQDEQVVEFLRLSGFYAPGRIRLETAVRLLMRTYLEANRDLISGLLIVNRSDLYASNELYRIRRYPLTEESWYKQAVAARGKRLLLPKPIGRNIRKLNNYSANDIVCISRAVFDPDTGEPLGVILVDMRLEFIDARIRDLRLGKSGYVFIQDDRAQVVFAPVNETVYRINADWLGAQASTYTVLGKRYQLLSTHSKETGWTTVGVFQGGEVLEPVVMIRRYTILFTFIAVLLAAVVALTFSASFTGPITELRLRMEEAERGNLNVDFDAKRYQGEIAQLGSSFNAMMEKIRTLLRLVYEEQRNKREADMRTLTAQIKPHFLYNTLDTIRWMAQEHGADDIVRMVGALTRLFRISLSRGKEIIPLSEELEHVRCYLYIQKVRYEDKLNYQIECERRFYDDPVNKLILQPLVENAIYHGIKQKRGAGHIWVRVVERENDLIFTVEDDGAGMSEEKITALNRALTAGGADYDHGYGIFNVNDRIRLSYGERYGLTYAQNDRGGVTVEIRFPRLNKEDQPGGGAEGGSSDVADSHRG